MNDSIQNILEMANELSRAFHLREKNVIPLFKDIKMFIRIPVHDKT